MSSTKPTSRYILCKYLRYLLPAGLKPYGGPENWQEGVDASEGRYIEALAPRTARITVIVWLEGAINIVSK